jgi:hypothetical protein
MAKSRRVPEQNVVPRTPIVLNKNSKEAKYMNPQKVRIRDSYASQNTAKIFSSPFNESAEDAFLIGSDNPETDVLDKVDLTDIESITIEKYYDPATKEQRGRAIIKVRNTSITLENVEGVDARIYNPNAS